jgi:hypothetical protein
MVKYIEDAVIFQAAERLKVLSLFGGMNFEDSDL